MLQVSRRGGFSDRNGLKSENTEIQLHKLDERTRIQIGNTISQIYLNYYSTYFDYEKEKQGFFRYVVSEIYSRPVYIHSSYTPEQIFEIIYSTIEKDEYHDVLSLVEGLAEYFEKEYDRYQIYRYGYKRPSIIFNELFQKEYVGYRFIDGIISPISDVHEIESINDALTNKYDIVGEHISKAHFLLANRDNPDYENSIKESISAVEALCQIITNTKGSEATLGKMLKKLEERGVVIHAALKVAFDKLYGYTSDANGIRHAGDVGGPSSTFAEAKFMLVSCCAFINYIMGVTAE